jgi:cytochrome c oxidase subunit 3
MSHAANVIPAPAGFKDHTVAHQFETAEQEFQASKLAFWLFLATEIMLFGGLFAGYFYYHGKYPETFAEGGKALVWWLGSLNTVVLILSSWTMAMAVRSSMLSRKKAMLNFLLATLFFAGVFMVVKYFEYSAKFEQGVGPGVFFQPIVGEGAHYAHLLSYPHMNLFFAFYFTMTGIHGLHVLVGMGLILWIYLRGRRGDFHAKYYMPVDLVGIYWHLVDLVWIFLFPLLYLVP